MGEGGGGDHHQRAAAVREAAAPGDDRVDAGATQAIEDAGTDERDKLIIRVLADCGLRLSELLGLSTGDLIGQSDRSRYLRVHGKGSKDRLVPVQPGSSPGCAATSTAPGRRSDLRSHLPDPPKNRTTGLYEPLKRRAVADLCDQLAAKAGITVDHHPHSFRHAFATFALQRGMNPLALQRVLGHSDLSMITNVYAHLSPADTHAALMAALKAEN